MRIALAQMKLHVGDIAENASNVVGWTDLARDGGADLVVFPEMTLVGYPPEDLVFRESFRNASVAALEKLAGQVNPEMGVIVGYLDHARDPRGVISTDTSLGTNSAAFLYGGKVWATYAKHHLPTYGVFDESRYFVPGNDMPIVRFKGIDIAMTICEDAWQKGTPFEVASIVGAQLIVSLNGSPFDMGKSTARRPLISQRATQAAAMVAYVNQVGGQDELVFDGDSFIVNADGEEVATAPMFTEDLMFYDTGLVSDNDGPWDSLGVRGFDIYPVYIDTSPDEFFLKGKQYAYTSRAKPQSKYEMMWNALVTGLRDYIQKNGFSSVVLGVSGGIDSAVCAAMAADAIGGENVYGIRMPSKHSSEGSLDDAEELMRNIGGHMDTFWIADPLAGWASLNLTGIAAENIQARVRGTTLMAISNQDGHLVLAPGNKSELAVGYSTIYGDAVGGFGPIKDVYKSDVFALAQWRAAQGPSIPANTISKPPSAELAPGQQDTDSLPPYVVLDDILFKYVEQDMGAEGIVASGHDVETVRKILGLVDRAEWKRRQYPPGTKISLKNFGRDRRLPITSRWKELV